MRKIQNPQSTIANEFIPLMQSGVARVGAESETSEPVSWFRHIAPQLPGSAAPTVAAPLPVQARGIMPAFASFRDVDEIAREEREQRVIGAVEPPEILQMRADAENAAKELVAQAYVQAQAIEEAARRQGYDVGYQAGYVDGKRDANRSMAQQAERDKAIYREDIQAFIAHIEAERQRAWDDMEPQVIQMVFELAKHVIKQEVEVSREVALSVVRNALRRVADGGSLRVRVNAEDLQTIRGNREELLTLVDNIRHVEIIEDRRVGVGGCIVETDAGNIDARLETQLAEAASLLDLPR